MRIPCREALRSGVAVLALLAASGAVLWLASGAQAQNCQPVNVTTSPNILPQCGQSGSGGQQGSSGQQSGGSQPGNTGQQGGSGSNCLVVFGCEPSRPYLPGNNSPGFTPVGNPLQPTCIQSTSVAIASTCPSPSASPSGGNSSSFGSSSSGGSSSGSSSRPSPTPGPGSSPSPSAAPSSSPSGSSSSGSSQSGSSSVNGASAGPPSPCTNCSDSDWAAQQAASWGYLATGAGMYSPPDGSAAVPATSDQIAAAQTQLQQCLTNDMAGAPQSADPQTIRQQVYAGCQGELSVQVPH